MQRMQKVSSLGARIAVLAALVLASSAAVPQQAGSSGRYTVEIVVVRGPGQGGALVGSVAAEPSADDGVEPTALPVRKLGGAASRLKSANGYRVLAHTAWSQMPSGFGSGRGVSVARLGLTRAGITGKVVLERRTKLLLAVDLTIEDGGRRYRISEVRKDIKPDQVMYFDHPAVAVLAVVTAGG